jgi:hypothetical protein
MTLSDSVKSIALRFLEQYKRAGLTVLNQGHTYPFREFDQKRVDAIPEILELLRDFLSGTVELVGLKESHEVLCRRHDYWGFKGFSGQMVLNQLTNWSQASTDMTRLLRASLAVPTGRSEAAQKLDSLHGNIGQLIPGGKNLRRASLPYLVSYFWQMQAPETIPVQYGSIKRTLAVMGLLEPNDGPGRYYTQFWDIQDALADLYAERLDITGANRYWFVEHVLWFSRHEQHEGPTPVPEGEIVTPGPTPTYMQYIPPVLQNVIQFSLGEGNSLAFEHQVIQLFRMLGFRVEGLGQGKGREPDGIAYCREHNYAILFDEKSSKTGYGIGTDDRTIVEYIRRYERELRKEGYSNIYYVIISSAFKGSSKASVDRVRADTPVKSLVHVTAEQALRLLASKIKDPAAFDFEEFHTLLLDSGELAQESLEEFLEE